MTEDHDPRSEGQVIEYGLRNYAPDAVEVDIHALRTRGRYGLFHVLTGFVVDHGIEAELALAIGKLLVVAGDAYDPAAVDVDRLAEIPLILTSRPNTLRMIVENALNRRSLSANIVMETSCFATVIEPMNAGLGYSVVPSSACTASLRAGALRGAPLKSVCVTWLLIRPRDRAVSVAQTRMRELLRATLMDALAGNDWPHARLWPESPRGLVARGKGGNWRGASRLNSLHSAFPRVHHIVPDPPSVSANGGYLEA